MNVNLAADFTAFIRKHEPQGVTVSVGGEIGEVGGKNSDVHELHAYMDGFNAALKAARRRLVGLSKISVQTGTAHGGFINADGTLRMDVKIDLKTLEELSNGRAPGLRPWRRRAARRVDAAARGVRRLPAAGACEIHLATDFQNMVYEHPQFPADLKAEMYAWIRENALEERKPKDTEEQFIYKARKKAIGPFKKRMWGLPEDAQRAIGQSLEDRFSFLMNQLRIRRHGRGCRALRQGAATGARSRRRDRRRRRKNHGGGEESRRARRLSCDPPGPRRLGHTKNEHIGFGFVVMVACAGAGCAKHYTSTGLVLKIDKPGSTVTISHEPFPGFMDAMAMPFDLKGGAQRVALTAGDRVKLRLAVKGGRSWVDRLDVVSAAPVDAGLEQTPVAPCWCPSARRCRTSSSPIRPGRRLRCPRSKARLSPSRSSTRAARCLITALGWSRTSGRSAQRFADRMARDLVLLTISFDPQYDTPQVLAHYAASHARRRSGLAFPDRRCGEDRARLQRVRDSVLCRTRG